MKTSSDFTALSPDDFRLSVVSLVWNTDRAMPAVFTSNGDRNQSFCIDFDGISANDEYQMASASWYWVSQYMEPDAVMTQKQTTMITRCGEDLMIASYIVQKLGRRELLKSICTTLIKDNKESWPTDFDALTIFATTSAKQWFAFCQEYGEQVANGKY